jgi:hypothetical protein
MAIAGNAATALLKRTTRPCTASSSARHNSGRRSRRSRRRRPSDRPTDSRLSNRHGSPHSLHRHKLLRARSLSLARERVGALSRLSRERLGSTGFDLGDLVGGFLDVHAIIRLDGAASSWYPVYDRVLPGCAERLSSAGAPLGAALHSPVDRTRARIRRASAAHPPIDRTRARIRRASAAHPPRIRRASAAHPPRIHRASAAHPPRIRRASAAHPPRIRRASADRSNACAHPPRIRRASAAAPSGGVWRRLCARSAALAADRADAAALLPKCWVGRTRR